MLEDTNSLDGAHIIDDRLLQETLLFTIRGETIKYNSRKKREILQEEKKLEEEIQLLEENLNDNLLNIDKNEILFVEEKRNKLYDIRQKKMNGIMLWSHCRYEDMGEKPTNYFLNLESRNYTSKLISKFINENGEEYTDTKDT